MCLGMSILQIIMWTYQTKGACIDNNAEVFNSRLVYLWFTNLIDYSTQFNSHMLQMLFYATCGV